MGRRRGQKQTLTSEDVGVLELGKDGKIEVDVIKKCNICGQEYSIYDPKKKSRLPNEWSEDEVLAHRIGHIHSPRVKRILGGFIALSDNDRGVALNFINEQYAGK